MPSLSVSRLLLWKNQLGFQCVWSVNIFAVSLIFNVEINKKILRAYVSMYLSCIYVFSVFRLHRFNRVFKLIQ